MPEFQVVLVLLVAVAGLGVVARRLGVPHPIVLVLGGLLVAVVPGVPRFNTPPDLILTLFLPPLVYVAAFNTSFRELHAQLGSILRLAVGLVLANTVVVAGVTYLLIPQAGWAAAFVLGAIVSPTDAVAATAIFRTVRVPRSLINLVEGESLLNDATGLVLYRVAVVAAVTGTFSVIGTATDLAFSSALGIAIGLVGGWIVGRLREHLADAPVEITISLLTPYAVFLPANAVGASGVLACVACGLYLGRLSPRIMGADTRLQGRAVWEMVIFTFNGLLFLLIGLQLPSILSGLGSRPFWHVLGLGLLISATVVVIRFAWVFLRDLPRLVGGDPAVRANLWREDVVVAWAGLRGAVSLAAALALPLTVADGSPFPERALLIFITMCVILTTLVGQGLTLPWVLRRVRLHVEELDAQEEATARETATQAAQLRIEELAEQWPTHLPLIETLRTQYAHRASHLEPPPDPPDGRPAGPGLSEAEQEMIDHRAIRGSVIDAQREAILDLRDSGQIGDNALRALERELDLEELRMEA